MFVNDLNIANKFSEKCGHSQGFAPHWDDIEAFIPRNGVMNVQKVIHIQKWYIQNPFDVENIAHDLMLKILIQCSKYMVNDEDIEDFF